MSKQLTVIFEPFSDYPTPRDEEEVATFDISKIKNKKILAIGIREEGDESGYIENITPLYHNDVENLLGKILTYVDATYSDPQQRKAQKDLARQTVYDWSAKLSTGSWQALDSNK